MLHGILEGTDQVNLQILLRQTHFGLGHWIVSSLIIAKALDQYLLNPHLQYLIKVLQHHQTCPLRPIMRLKCQAHLKLLGRPTHAVQTLILGEVVKTLPLLTILDCLVHSN